MICSRLTSGLVGIACAALFTSQSALGQASALMDDIRVELPPELTAPETRSVTGVFTVPAQSVYGGGLQPSFADSVSAQIVPRNVSVGAIERVCVDPGGCIGIDVPNSRPGVDLEIIKYFGIEFGAGLSGAAEIGYDVRLFDPASPQFINIGDGFVPIEVTVELPAYNTIAPGQQFFVESSWRIDESAQDFTFTTTEPDLVNVDTTLDFDLEIFLDATICVFGCIDIDITITLPTINLNLLNFDILPFRFCALFNDLVDDPGFCPIDACQPFIDAGLQCPYLSVSEDPYNHYPIPGLEDIAPGAATIDVLKAAEDGELEFATTARTAPLQPRKFISSSFNYPVAGMTLDLANASAALLQLPPLNGSATDLFAWKGKSLNPVATQFANLLSYNIFDASLGFDLVLGQQYTMLARAPTIRVQYNDPGGQYDIDESFRAGTRRMIRMPDQLDPGDLTITVMENAPRFTTRVAAPVDPRFELTGLGASVAVPGVGEVALNPIFQTGDLLPPPPLFDERSFDVLTSGSFSQPALYDLAPIQRPNEITGTVLNQPGDGNLIPRLITTGGNEEINFATVDLSDTSNGVILVVPPGLQSRNTQFNDGTFNLLANGGTSPIRNDDGSNERFITGTWMTLGGNSLTPGLDGVTVNLAIGSSANSNDMSDAQIRGGLEFSTNDGAYIRNSTINAGQFEDGTMLIIRDESPFDIIGPQPLMGSVTVKGEVVVYPGNNTNPSSAASQPVDLEITNSTIRATDFTLSTSIIGSNSRPVIVTLEDSVLDGRLDMAGRDSQLLISGNSLFAAGNLTAQSSRNSGLIDVRGNRDALTGDTTASSVLDSGFLFQNTSGQFQTGTIVVGAGGIVSVRSGNTLSSTGKLDLIGSYDGAGAESALATLATLTPGFTAEDLSAAFIASPVDDALLLIEGGTVSDHMISSLGATVLGRGGSINGSTIDTENGRLIVDNGTFGYAETLLRGDGIVHVRPGSILSMTAGDLVDNEVEPLIRALGQQVSDGFDPVYARRKIELRNEGGIEIAAGPSAARVVELRGDAERNGHLWLQNLGDLSIANGQRLQVRGDAAIDNRNTINIDAGGVLAILDQQFPTTDPAGNPTIGVIGPKFVQHDGQTTINGTVTYDMADNVLEIAGGSADGTGIVEGNVLNSAGTVAPGRFLIPAGTLAISGDYVQSSTARLQTFFNLSGNAFLQVGGTAALAGELAIVVDVGWWNSNPFSIGDTFAIMSHSGITGSFDSVTLALSDGTEIADFTFDVTYNANDVTVMYAEVDDERDVAEGIYDELGQFQDVSSDTFAFSFIETLGQSGITGGCGNGEFCPNDPVTRAQMAVFLERGMRGSNYVPPAATGAVFADVGATDFAAAFIEQLFADGITNGCGNNNYCPNQVVSRAQMAVFLLRARYGAAYSPPAPSGIFPDAPLGSFAVAWVEQLAAEGISSGCGGGNFCPNNPVTRAQMAVFLVRTFDLGP